jgi:hypothetical protein
MRKDRGGRAHDGARTREETESARRMEAAIRRRTEESERSFAEALERWKRNRGAAAEPVAPDASRPWAATPDRA